MPYFLMFLQVALNRLRMNDFKRPRILQLQHPQNLLLIKLFIVAFMVLTVGAALQYSCDKTSLLEISARDRSCFLWSVNFLVFLLAAWSKVFRKALF